ncbi:MAG TPA: decaprenyl-phosphate phosphoribosyltransferase [Phycicoccus sp.]|nr:decaprenyl-phosphate phosphoribosyltransferase [Phycicoccus sp.]HRA45132.1 decaprenyl-phosphate phosphoribosyltransferase [Phycicoccus sp.]
MTEPHQPSESPAHGAGDSVWSIPRALLKACRPRQWVKNVLVLAAPVAGGVLAHWDKLALGVLGMVAFILASSAVYLINDIVDVELDRAHPTKRNRPIAAGLLPIPLAWAAAVVLLVGAPALALLANWHLSAVIVIYLVLSLAYSLRLKAEPVIELFLVASGFLLRAIAGGVATGIDLSHWFVLTAGFGSLFVAAGKRYGELHRLQAGLLSRTRPVLEHYTTTYLRFVWTVSAGAVCLTYAQWALSRFGDQQRLWTTLSIVPFIMALMRYAVDVDRGEGGEPEEIILKDRQLIVLGALWVLSLGIAVYL